MISLGKVFQMFGADVAFVMTVGSVYLIINSLPLVVTGLKIVPEVHSQPLSHLS